MVRTFLAGLLAVTLVVTPAFAAKKSAAKKTVKSKAAQKAPKKAVRFTIEDFERDAWGDSAPKRVIRKSAVKKPAVAKKKEPLKPTVTLHGTTKKPPVAVTVTKPVTPTVTPKPTAVAATSDAATKDAEDLEKEAREQKDPNKALATYNQLLEKNPNYPYSGDVYKNMYQLSLRNGSDTLTQLQFAGKAAKALEQGRSRGPGNPRDIQNLNRAADDLIQRWIEETTRKIISEAGQRR